LDHYCTDISALESIVIQRHVPFETDDGAKPPPTETLNEMSGRTPSGASMTLVPEENGMADRLTALIVGASRGLGLALAEEWLKRDARVIATVRSDSQELKALQDRFPGSLEIKIVDIVDVISVRTLRDRLGDRKFDVLFVNAGICKANEKTPSTVDEQDFVDMMLTNALAPMRLIELLESLVPASGVLAVMTSELGSIAGNPGHWELYSSSKAAVNMLMKCFAARHQGDCRTMLLVAPGWVRTDMGGPAASLSVEETIPFVVDSVERNRGKPGLRFIDRNNRTLPW
jgi:NAD(P)-dependent dehydrogenase (short-subunit alcohol dehydrogenase family)